MINEEELHFSMKERQNEEEKINKMILREKSIEERDIGYTEMLNITSNNKYLKVFLGYIYKFTKEERNEIIDLLFDKNIDFKSILQLKIDDFNELINKLKE